MNPWLLLGASACGGAAEGRRAEAPPTEEAAMAEVESVRITLVGRKGGRPPLERLALDVVLHNPASGPRWYLLPTSIGAEAEGGVDGVEVFSGGGVVLARFQGRAGFAAVAVPAGATVTVGAFELRSWLGIGKTPEALSVVEANGFTVGGEPAAAWVGERWLSTGGARTAETEMKAASSRHTPDRSEVPVALEGARTISVPLR